MSESVELVQELKQLIIDVSQMRDLSATDIKDQTELFGGGLGLDSIDVLELAVRLDKKYGFKLKNDDESRAILQNFGSVAKAVQQYLQMKEAGVEGH